jgi:hypothetical protein
VSIAQTNVIELAPSLPAPAPWLNGHANRMTFRQPEAVKAFLEEPSCRIATPRKNEKARSPAFRRNLGWPRFRLKPVLRTFSEENEKARSPAFRRNLGWPRFRLKPVLRTFSEELARSDLAGRASCSGERRPHPASRANQSDGEPRVVARALGLSDHRAAAIEIAERLAREPRALPGQTERTMNG